MGFRDETFDIQLPQAPHSEEGNSHGSGTESYFGSLHRYSIHHFKLDRLVSDIKLHLYHLPTDSTWLTWPQDATDDQQRINRALDSWWSEAQQGLFDLPGIEAQQQRVWKLKLKIRYHTVKILLFQPSQVIQNPSTLAVQICFDNASSILSEYQDLYDLRGLHMGWRSVQNIFSAGATLIYSFWMSSGVQKTVSTPAMCRHLRTCSNLLSIGGESWPSVRNGQRSFDSVVDLTVRKLYEGDTRPSKVSRLSANASHPTTRTGPHLNADGIGQQGTEGLGTERSIDHAHGEYGFGDEAMFRPDDGQPNQEMWTGAEMAVQDGASRFDPEVESFLAEFDQSEFTWSFPINENPPPVIHFGLPPM